MYPVVLFFIVLIGLCIADIRGEKRSGFTKVSVACLCCLFLTGCAGTLFGYVLAFEALATPGLTMDEKTQMLNIGAQIALNPGILAAMLGIPSIWMIALAHRRRRIAFARTYDGVTPEYFGRPRRSH